MKRMCVFSLCAVLAGVFGVLLFADSASAYYHPSLGGWMCRDPGAGGGDPTRTGPAGPSVRGGFLPRDQYTDGMNLHQYVRSQPTNMVDPKGTYGDETHNLGTWFHGVQSIIDAWLEQKAYFIDLPACLRFATDTANANQACDYPPRDAISAWVAQNVENYNLHFPGAAYSSSGFWDLNPVSAGMEQNALVRQMVREAVEDCNVTWMGEALHALQDSFAHEGKPALGGHPERKILEGARWDPGTMLFATEINEDVGGTWVPGGGLLDTRLDDPRYDPHRHADALADTLRALKEFWGKCLCKLCGPGASERESGE